RVIGPVLEKLEREYAGRFVLAKINTDHEQSLAGAFQISGIPAVKLFSNGRVKDEFVGALPESQIRAFLEKNVPDPRLTELAQKAEKSPAETLAGVQSLGVQNDATDAALLLAARAQVRAHGVDSLARQILEAIREFGGPPSDARRALLAYAGEALSDEEKTALQSMAGDETEQRKALEFFLANVSRTKGDERTRYKNGMLACFHLVGNKGPLVDEYGRKLSATLY
ncbi:MAG: tetratricopeptide repeat protein, partial [Spirochaetia bacterium]|nr:tetratricopeptide repeat protein [Spirochaetia bacterium]